MSLARVIYIYSSFSIHLLSHHLDATAWYFPSILCRAPAACKKEGKSWVPKFRSCLLHYNGSSYKPEQVLGARGRRRGGRSRHASVRSKPEQRPLVKHRRVVTSRLQAHRARSLDSSKALAPIRTSITATRTGNYVLSGDVDSLQLGIGRSVT